MKWSLGQIWHKRSHPVVHEFAYNTLYWILDLDEIRDVKKHGLFQVRAKDYLTKKPLSLKEKFYLTLSDNGIDARPKKVYMHTVPKFLGIAFNPVSFYIGEGEGCNYFVMEINNTFGEKHSYASTWENTSEPLEINVHKVFHVSPFNPLNDTYYVKVEPRSDNYSVRVDIIKDQIGTFFESTVAWQPREWKASMGYQIVLGFEILMTTVRIIYHAAILYLRKKQGVFDLPTSPDAKTIRWGKPILLQRLLAGEWLEKLQK